MAPASAVGAVCLSERGSKRGPHALDSDCAAGLGPGVRPDGVEYDRKLLLLAMFHAFRKSRFIDVNRVCAAERNDLLCSQRNAVDFDAAVDDVSGQLGAGARAQ